MVATDPKKITNILKALRNRKLDDQEQEMLALCLAVECENTAFLEAFIASDRKLRVDNFEKIQKAIDIVKGRGFTLSSRGISRTIDARFDDTQKALILKKMCAFSDYLKDKLDIESFVTSGTLLGLVRERKFLDLDDDFDMAFVSNASIKQGIVDERSMVMNVINDHPDFTAQERTGGLCTVLVRTDDINFNFRLFVAFRQGEFLNIYPLQPNTLFYDDVSPVKKKRFYGQATPIPRLPASLLKVKYGPGWRRPDPSFRFNFGKHREFYKFLIDGKYVKRTATLSTAKSRNLGL